MQDNSKNEIVSTPDLNDIFTISFNKLFGKLRNQCRIFEIARIEIPNRQIFLSKIEPASYPCVFRFKNKEDSYKDAVLAKLQDDYADMALTVRVGNYADPEEYLSRRQIEHIALMSYLQLVKKQNSDLDNLAYAGNINPPISLLRDLSCLPPSFYEAGRYESPNMWLGGSGSITPLHKDGSDNFAVHLFGRKRWTLFPVRDIPSLYMRRVLLDSDFAVSKIDLRYPDLNEYPEYSNAVGVEVEVGEGEILYLPQGWGHYVENLELTLMINYWIKDVKK